MIEARKIAEGPPTMKWLGDQGQICPVGLRGR